MLIRLCQKFGEYNKVTSLIDCITCRPVPHSNCTADLIVFFFIKLSAGSQIRIWDSLTLSGSDPAIGETMEF